MPVHAVEDDIIKSPQDEREYRLGGVVNYLSRPSHGHIMGGGALFMH